MIRYGFYDGCNRRLEKLCNDIPGRSESGYNKPAVQRYAPSNSHLPVPYANTKILVPGAAEAYELWLRVATESEFSCFVEDASNLIDVIFALELRFRQFIYQRREHADDDDSMFSPSR